MPGKTTLSDSSTTMCTAGWTAEIRRGMQASVPLIIGFIPIAISYGVLAVQTGITLFHTVAMSILVFAGASQFMAVNMIGLGIGALEIVIATFVLNFRHFILNLSLMNRLKHVPLRWRAALSFGITDEIFAVGSMEGERSRGPLSFFFMVGLAVGGYGAWVIGSLAGGLLSMIIPPAVGSSMSIALYAMFIGLLIPAARDSWRVGLIAGISAGICSLLYTVGLSNGWSIVLATLLGGMTGIWLIEQKQKGVQQSQAPETGSNR